MALRLMSEDRGRRWNPMTMDRATIDLQPGSNTLTLNLPALYQLEVEAPGLEEGARVTARKISKDPGERDYSVSARVDANGRAVIGDLITGTYKVSASGRDQTVEVPSGMIVLEAKGKK